ncbi:MAG: nitroreductase family protein [Cystobacter sp.]
MDEHKSGPETAWQTFQRIVSNRRAIRDFDGRAIDEAALKDVLQEALSAPTSGNIQPYQFHWVRDPELKARVAAACNGQKAASSASTLVVVTAAGRTAARSLESLDALLARSALPPRSLAYHGNNHKILRRFLRFAPWSVFGVLRVLLSFFVPRLSLLPIGPAGTTQWFARNSIYAAQTFLLAAAARGFDTCPMEGFDAMKVGRLLDLPRGSVISLVIAVGHRREDARLEPRLRRSFDEAVVVH